MKIIFINHSCGRTGAPLVLLYFIQWLKESHPEIHFDILSLSGGPLEKDFDMLTRNHFKPFKKKILLRRILRFVLRKLNFLKLNKNDIYNYQLKNLSKREYDIIYQNTVVGLETSSELKRLYKKSKLILHLHELEETISHFSPNFYELKNSIDFTICASDKVRCNLINNYKINKNNCSTVYEFSNIEQYEKLPKELKEDKIVIVGAGYVSLRKGVDLFLQTIKILEDLEESLILEFQWLGEMNSKESLYYEDLLEELNIRSQVSFIGQLENPIPFYNKADIFLMTSREDPFPLVCIEAANSGLPIFCFNNTTGTQEIINDLDFLIAPQFRTDILAIKIMSLLNNPQLYTEVSKEMIIRFSQFNISNQSEKLYKIIINEGSN